MIPNRNPMDPLLAARVRDLVAANDSGAVMVLDLLTQFSELLKEQMVTADKEEGERLRGAIQQIRRFIHTTTPIPESEHATRNSYIPEQ